MDDVRPELKRPGARRLALTALVLALAAGASACGHLVGAEAIPGAFAETHPSKETAAQALLDALGARDADRLLALAVTEHEFTRLVWPALPSSRPEFGMPVEYAWADTFARSRGHLVRLIETHGGTAVRVDAVTFGRPPVDYGTFRLHPDTSVRVRDATGASRELRVCGSMIETPDGWKVFSYIVD
jgi:hypothetical protein